MIIKVYVLFLIGLFSQIALGEICSEHNPGNNSIPLCPEKGRILNETFPVSMAFVSTNQGGQNFVNSFAREILTAGNSSSPTSPEFKYPTIFLSGSENECAALKKYLHSIVGEKKAEKIVVCSTEKTSYNWQQDVMQGHFDPQTGQPVLDINADYESSEGAPVGENFHEQFSKTVPGICPKVKVNKVNLWKRSHFNAASGGNFAGIPPHFCVVGRGDAHIKKEFNQLTRDICGNAEVIEAPTSFLALGHTDEIMKTIPSGDPYPCHFKLLVADQSLAEEELSSYGGKLFDENNKDHNKFLENSSSAQHTCSQARELRKQETEEDETRSTSFLNDLLKGILTINAAHGELPLDYEFQSQRGPASSSGGIQIATLSICDELNLTGPECCEGVTGREFIEGFHVDNKKFSKIVDKQLDDFAENLKKKIGRRCPDSIIRVPTLFYTSNPAYMDGVSDDDTDIKFARGHAVFPNMTNGVAIGSKLIFPDQVVTPYNNYLNKITAKTSLDHSKINTLFAHKKWGNLHCSTNLVRYCRPRR